MKKVKLALIGAGTMGVGHLDYLTKMENVELVAVCDAHAPTAQKAAAQFNTKAITDYRQLLDPKNCAAVLIATPHYSHTTIGIDALKAGLHVLVEKPISVHKADCQKLIAAHKNKKQIFAAMFQQRTVPCYQKLKQLIDTGELGPLVRVNWIITDWFRTEAYYASGSWRATWAGEGGGVLLNQCPHQLDLLQWLCGMPTKVTAFCSFGKRHKIEVEDEVTAYLEYKNGATGVFIASTGEHPGTNRLEIAGERGKVTVEDTAIKFVRNEVPTTKFSRTTKEAWSTPDVWNIEIPITPPTSQHRAITENFVNAILHRQKLVAPAAEGINSVELGNAMLHSHLTGKTVNMPLDAAAFQRKLKQLIKQSKK